MLSTGGMDSFIVLYVDGAVVVVCSSGNWIISLNKCLCVCSRRNSKWIWHYSPFTTMLVLVLAVLELSELSERERKNTFVPKWKYTQENIFYVKTNNSVFVNFFNSNSIINWVFNAFFIIKKQDAKKQLLYWMLVLRATFSFKTK